MLYALELCAYVKSTSLAQKLDQLGDTRMLDVLDKPETYVLFLDKDIAMRESVISMFVC